MDDPRKHDDGRVGAHEDQQNPNVKAAQNVLFQQLGQEHGGQGEIQQVVVKNLRRIEFEKPKPASQKTQHDDHKEGGNDPNQLQQSPNPSFDETKTLFQAP